jgi:hypothetical protein
VAPIVASYTESTVVLTLTAIGGSAAGSSPVLYYDLNWDMGANDGLTWVSYTISSSLSVTINGLTSGQMYSFKYRA